MKSRSIFPNQSVGKKFSGIENPGWDSLINQIPQVASDRKVTESLGSSKESRFIRFALAVKLNTFETPLEPKDLARYEVEIYSAMATAEPPLFHDFQSLALTGFKDQEFEKERAAVQGLLGAAAKENRYAQMIIQDLIIRDFYRDPNQSMLDIAQKYEITPNHPLYSTLMSASNRMPASLYQK